MSNLFNQLNSSNCGIYRGSILSIITLLMDLVTLLERAINLHLTEEVNHTLGVLVKEFGGCCCLICGNLTTNYTHWKIPSSKV